jgi:hypothetical protein
MPVGLDIPDSLLYQPPVQNADGDINWVRYTPFSGTTFTPNQTCKLRITSANEFLVPQRSYLRFDLTFTASTIGDVRISSLGGASVLKRITTTVSGVQVEDIDHYNTYVSTIYKRLPDTNKNFLKQSEAYEDTDAFSSASGKTVYHPLRTALLEQDKYLPVAFWGSGFDIDIEFESLALVQNGTAGTPTNYTISNVEFVACMIKPSDSYLRAYQNSLASGKWARMHLQLTKNIRISPSATTEQESNMLLGVHRSLRSVLGINRLTASFGAAADSFNSDSNEGLKSYYFQIGSNRYPRNKAVECSVNSGPVQVENMMMALCSLDNTYGHFNQPDGALTTSNYIYFNWASSPTLGSGVILEDGTLNLVRSYNSAPATTSITDLFFVYDALFRFNAIDVYLDSKEFE